MRNLREIFPRRVRFGISQARIRHGNIFFPTFVFVHYSFNDIVTAREHETLLQHFGFRYHNFVWMNVSNEIGLRLFLLARSSVRVVFFIRSILPRFWHWLTQRRFTALCSLSRVAFHSSSNSKRFFFASNPLIYTHTNVYLYKRRVYAHTCMHECDWCKKSVGCMNSCSSSPGISKNSRALTKANWFVY